METLFPLAWPAWLAAGGRGEVCAFSKPQPQSDVGEPSDVFGTHAAWDGLSVQGRGRLPLLMAVVPSFDDGCLP